MAELAFEDPLTGVANRRALDERLELAVPEAVAGGRDLAVLLCDVDNLKELNDAPRPLGRRRRRSSAWPTCCARRRRRRGAARRARRRRRVLRRARGRDGRRRPRARRARDRAAAPTARARALTVSCGVASVGVGARRVGDLLRAADAAQYTAKRSGRARVCVADGLIEDEWRARQRRAPRDPRARRARHARRRGAARRRDRRRSTGRSPAAWRSTAPRPSRCAVSRGRRRVADRRVARAGAGSSELETVFLHDRRLTADAATASARGHRYVVADYPATERLLGDGGSFLVAADDPTRRRGRARACSSSGA